MNFKVLLKKDVKNLGFVGDLIKVKKGFARNFLFPQKLAVEVTERGLQEVQHFKKMAEAKIKKQEKQRSERSDSLSKTQLIFKRAGDAKGQMFGSVTAFNISVALEEQTGLSLGRKAILLEAPLKTSGSHSVEVSLGHGVKTKIEIMIELELPKDQSVDKKARHKSKEAFAESEDLLAATDDVALEEESSEADEAESKDTDFTDKDI